MISDKWQIFVDYYTYLQNHEFDKALAMKTGGNQSVKNLENLYNTVSKIVVSKITDVSWNIYQIELTMTEPCIQESYVVKKQLINDMIKDISSKMISSVDVGATGENMVKVENDFFCFFADHNTKIEWPQNPKFQAFGSPVFAFSVITWGMVFMYDNESSRLFFDDAFGTQRWVQIPITYTWQDQANFLGGLAKSIQFKINDEKEYKKLMKFNYPEFKVGSLPSTQSNKKIILNAKYSKDSQYVYLDGEIVPGLDPNTAELVWYRYIKDAKNVYRWPKKIEWADAASFTDLSPTFSKDKNYVYHDWDILTKADPETFEIIPVDTNETFIAKDKNYVYTIEGKIIPWIDIGSFKLLDNLYYKAQDKNFIYGSLLPSSNLPVKFNGIDAGTFQVIWGEYSTYANDKNHVYYIYQLYNIKIIDWADMDSFQSVNNNRSYDALDKNHTYKNWMITE